MRCYGAQDPFKAASQVACPCIFSLTFASTYFESTFLLSVAEILATFDSWIFFLKRIELFKVEFGLAKGICDNKYDHVLNFDVLTFQNNHNTIIYRANMPGHLKNV